MDPCECLQTISKRLKEAFDDNATYLLQDTSGSPKQGRAWMYPAVDSDWSGGWDCDIFNIEDIKLAFDRTQSNKDATETLSPKHSLAERNAKLIEIALLSVMERSFRLRHMTSARVRLHTAGRFTGMSQDKGYWDTMVSTLQDLLAQTLKK